MGQFILRSVFHVPILAAAEVLTLEESDVRT